jgi:hypothetical protein
MNIDGWQAGLVLGAGFVALLDFVLRARRAWKQWGYRRNHTCPYCHGEVRSNGRGYGAAEYLDVCHVCGDTSVAPEHRM